MQRLAVVVALLAPAAALVAAGYLLWKREVRWATLLAAANERSEEASLRAERATAELANERTVLAWVRARAALKVRGQLPRGPD